MLKSTRKSNNKQSKIKFNCKNYDCDGYCFIPKNYEFGKGLKADQFKQIEVECNKCKFKHSISMRYARSKSNNILAYHNTIEQIHKLKIINGFWFTKPIDTLNFIGYINDFYLTLGFDDKELMNKINSIKNEIDKITMQKCFVIIKIIRNKITHHNKEKYKTSLTNNEVFSLFINSSNTIVNLLIRNDVFPFDKNDKKRMKKRELILEK